VSCDHIHLSLCHYTLPSVSAPHSEKHKCFPA